MPAHALKSSAETGGSDILDLVSQYPIFRSIVENLRFWDLIQFSRTSTSVRSVCHGFIQDSSYEGPEHIPNTRIKVALRLGQHNTSTWRLYKSLTSKHCSEPDHTKGDEGLGCRLCSRPVCFACIVKHSFGKEEHTFLLRGRALCEQCLGSGNPHSEHILVQGNCAVKIAYDRLSLCQCASQDGILCSGCKEKQNEDSSHKYKQRCAGNRCYNPVNTNSPAVRVCLWCDLALPSALPKLKIGKSSLFAKAYESGSYGLEFLSSSSRFRPLEPEAIESASGGLVIIPIGELGEVQSPIAILAPPNHDWPPPNDALPAYSLYPVEVEQPSSHQV